MAHFAKFANLSSKGWNAAKATQTVSVGQNAHIGLWGGDASGRDLDVKSADPSICIVHEEPRPKGWANWRHFLITGLSDGETRIDAFLAGTSNAYSVPVNVKVTGKAAVSMIFFPGERLNGSDTLGTIYVVGLHGESIAAAGGPPVGGPDRGGHTFEPTPAGHYILGPQKHVTTTSWVKSVIAWGAALRLNADDEVEYEVAPGKWRIATGPKGTVTAAKLAFNSRGKVFMPMSDVLAKVRAMFISPSTGQLRSTTWQKNDFGRWGWQLIRNGQSTPYIIHTTPENERETETGKDVELSNSHGCVHVKPAERDRLIKAGVLKQGVAFEVRPYTEQGPP